MVNLYMPKEVTKYQKVHYRCY